MIEGNININKSAKVDKGVWVKDEWVSGKQIFENC